MKTNQNFTIAYILMVIVQIIIFNYLNLSTYISLSILPAALMLLPLNLSTIVTMLIAFVTGLSVDFLADGLPGLNAAALVPVALTQKTIVRWIVDKDFSVREGTINISHDGFFKVSASVMVAIVIYFAVYVIVDSGGTRPASFNLIKLAMSSLCSYLLSVPILFARNNSER